MLTQFTMAWTFNSVRVRMWVETGPREAAIAIQDARTGLLLIEHDLPPADAARVLTPEAAAAWMREPMGETGSRLEHLDWSHRRGLYRAAA